MRSRILLFILIAGAAIALTAGSAGACGGFFCQASPVDQTGERIVFTVNDDGTITTLIQIEYFGEAEDFSWILPIPEAIDAEALAVPEDGDDVFTELHALTDVQVIAPPQPDCAADDLVALAESATDDGGGVDVFASGEVGPFGFDIVGSEDPDALVTWLRDNNYQVTPEMEPLIDPYVENQFAFVAMRLLDGQDSDSISPIEITYPGTEPMIPLVLTAVAAQPNMPVWVWIFGDERAVGTNYANMEIATEEISFFPFGGNDYTFLVQQRANAHDGHAFITEFAGPADSLDLAHPWLVARASEQRYLTRLSTYIDPAEMTLDPVFGFDGTLADVSNIRDASNLKGLYSCERQGEPGIIDRIFGGAESDAIDPMDGTGVVVAFTPGEAEDTQTSTTTSAATDPTSSTSTDALASAPIADDDSSRTTVILIIAGVLLVALGGVVGGSMARRSG